MSKAQDIIKRFTTVQTLPHVAVRLNKLLSDDNSSMMDFEEIINLDPSLVLRLLRVVNSAHFGMRDKVSNISRAVMIVGMKNLRNLVVGTAMKDIFSAGSEEDVFSRSQLWIHSVAVSICAKMISEKIFGKIGEDVYLCGLLHDIGLIVEDQVVHKKLVQVCETYTPDAGSITDHEKKIIGTDHCMIGNLLAQEWKLPPHVQDGIKNHHKLTNGTSPSSEAGIIQMADFLVSELNYPAIKGMKAQLSPDLADYLQQNNDEFQLLINEFPEEMSRAEGLFDSADEPDEDESEDE
jgi:putative nucleotidyltransferase with HDIG domain